jgi:hypothetical protein
MQACFLHKPEKYSWYVYIVFDRINDIYIQDDVSREFPFPDAITNQIKTADSIQTYYPQKIMPLYK